MKARAEARFIRMSPRKARLVLDLIRGRDAEEAMNVLRFTKKRAARQVEKVLHSAVANAKDKADQEKITLDVDNLYVAEAYAGDGPRGKRIRPAPMGRAHPYQRRTCHIVVQVAERVEAAAVPESS